MLNPALKITKFENASKQTAESFLRSNILFLSCLALWHDLFKSRWKSIFYIALWWLLCFTVISVWACVFLNAYVQYQRNDVNEISASLSIALLFAQGLSKWLFSFRNKSLVNVMLEKFEDTIVYYQKFAETDSNNFKDRSSDLKNKLEMEIRKNYYYGKYVMTFWILYCVIGGVHWVVNPFLIPQYALNDDNTTTLIRKFFLPVYLPDSCYVTPMFELVYLLLFVVDYFIILSVVSFDSLFINSIFFLRGQVKSLKIILKQLVDEQLCTQEDHLKPSTGITNNAPPVNEKIDCSRELNFCIGYHQKILSSATTLNDVFSDVMFVQCQIYLFTLCLLAFEAVSVDGFGDGKVMNVIEFLISVISVLYLFCSLANELTYQLSSVSESAYDVAWHDMEESLQKTVMMLVEKAQQPFLLTGGKFYVLSLQTFIDLLQLSFSFFTVLRQITKSNDSQQ